MRKTIGGKFNMKKIGIWLKENWEDVTNLFVLTIIIIWGAVQENQNELDVRKMLLGISGILVILTIAHWRDRAIGFSPIKAEISEINTLLKEKEIIKIVGGDEFLFKDSEINQRIGSSIEDSFQHADNISILGHTLNSSIRDYERAITERLEKNAKIRLMLPDMNQDYILEQIVAISYNDSVTIDFYRNLFDNNCGLVRNFKKSNDSTGSLELGFLSYIPPNGITMVDPALKNGYIYVKQFQPKISNFNGFLLNAYKEPITFEYYRKQFDLMWDDCTKEKIH
jgi:hypothetical protein